MADIFFSYSQKDRDRVRPIVSRLEREGFSVWWDASINPGETFRKIIIGELEKANCVVVAWSQASIESNWVIDEAEHGRDSGKLIPINLDGIRPPIGFRQIQTIDFRDRDTRVALRVLVSGIRKLLKPSADPAPEPEIDVRPEQQWQGPRHRLAAHEIGQLPRRSRVGLIVAIITVLFILSLLFTAYSQRDRIAALVRVVRGPAPSDALQPRPDETRDTQKPRDQEEQSTANSPAVTGNSRVVYYEEDLDKGKKYNGSAKWRTEAVKIGRGAETDIVVRADLEVPERQLTLNFSIRRNLDKALPASHTIEVAINLPADFAFGGISSVPGILMKQAEQTRGAPLAGLAVKVTSGFFLVGLSSVEADMQRNLQLLKERGWFDIPIVYNNGRRAILALEKGKPGEKAFDEAFKAWGQ